ncbi:MAG: hypothetical protein LBS60_06830 [Deltaproteobacteria bacterium]|jgi:hypothetical protein|nr:hypothetical protein [Deltaproteobacteria bacterium]
MASLAPQYHVIKEENPDQVTQADLVVGFLSRNDAPTISRMATKVSEGWRMDYPGLSTALVLSDCHSQDQTLANFFQTHTGPPKLAVVAPPEKDQATQTLFNLLMVASRLKAKIVLVQTADTLTIKRTWLRRLINPIADDLADFTNPLYSRNAIDAPVTNLMVYPMFRALFGRRLRQPILTDWAFNDQVLAALLAYKDWPDHSGLLVPELMVKTIAVTSGFRICQSIMTEGRYGLSNKRMDTPHIIKMFQELTLGVFETMIRFKEAWRAVKRSKPTSVIGTDLKPGIFPIRYDVNLKELYNEIQALLAATEPEWRRFLADRPESLRPRLLTASLEDINVSAREWGLFLFYCGNLYATLAESDRPKLLEAMTPVFLARFLSFQKQTIGLLGAQVEAKVEESAAILEWLKKELIS